MLQCGTRMLRAAHRSLKGRLWHTCGAVLAAHPLLTPRCNVIHWRLVGHSVPSMSK